MNTYFKPFQLIISGLLLVLGLFWIWPANNPTANPSLTTAPCEGFLAPEVDLQTFGNEQFSTAGLEGKALILNFWASWCPPCRAEMPDFQQASQEFDNSDVLIVGINATNQDALNDVTRFLGENAITFPIALDTLGQAARDYQVHSLPTTFFIDADGVIQKIVIGGPLPLPFLRIEAERLIEGSN